MSNKPKGWARIDDRYATYNKRVIIYNNTTKPTKESWWQRIKNFFKKLFQLN
jgi:hypothetical protein